MASSASASSARVLYQAGVAFQRGGRHAQACSCFRRSLEGLDLDAHGQDRVLAFKALWNLSQSSLTLGEDAAAEAALRSALGLLLAADENAERGPEEELREGLCLVYLNLSAVLARRGEQQQQQQQQLEEALAIAEQGLGHFPFDCALGVQQGALLRRLGRQAEALERVWAALAYHRGEQQQPPPQPSSIPAPSSIQAAPAALHVLMVKVGRKYPSDHANRLARAVRRHLPSQAPLEPRVLCLTDDAAGLDMDAIDAAVPFPAAAAEEQEQGARLPGWWAKAALFSPALPVPPGAPILYFDLDTVLLGDLRPLLRFFDGGPTTSSFAILGSEALRSEGGRPGGLNTSVMMWRAHDPRWTPLYTDAGPEVARVVSKFDWWVEMLAARGGGDGSVVRIQERWPGLVVEYQALASDEGATKPGAGAAVIVFPLRPKPADLVDSVPWIREHWK